VEQTSSLPAGWKPAPPGPLAIDAEHFRTHFNQTPHLIRHNLGDHPLFTLPRLIELARRLPEEHVEYNAGNIPISINWHKTPPTGLSIEETIRRIEECCSWMFLKRVELDPEYKAALDEVLDQVQQHSEPLFPGMYDRAGAIFISSPNAITPYHMDEEYNFLLQMRGSKIIHVYPGKDRELLSDEELETHVTRTSNNRNLVYRPEFEQKAHVFDLRTGHALHIPALDPHYVKNGPEVSISFSCGFFTPHCERQWIVHQVNRRLRRLGIRPAPFDSSPWRDTLKCCVYRGARRVKRLWGSAAPAQSSGMG